MLKRFVLVFAAIAASVSLLAEMAAADTLSDEQRFVQLINQDRAAHGLGALSVDGNLANVARNHSARMAASGTIYHNSNLASEAPSGWQTLGENVGHGGSVDALHAAFMASPSHRANVLGDYDRAGIGIVMSGEAIFVTELFWKTASAPSATVGAKKARKGKKFARSKRAKRTRRSAR